MPTRDEHTIQLNELWRNWLSDARTEFDANPCAETKKRYLEILNCFSKLAFTGRAPGNFALPSTPATEA